MHVSVTTIPCQCEVISLGSRQVKVLELREVGDQAGEGVGGQHLEHDEHENWEEEGQEEE